MPNGAINKLIYLLRHIFMCAANEKHSNCVFVKRKMSTTHDATHRRTVNLIITNEKKSQQSNDSNEITTRKKTPEECVKRTSREFVEKWANFSGER